MLGKEIKSHFYLMKKEYDCQITILMEGKDKDLMRYIMEQICFEVPSSEYEFAAYTPDENTRSLERIVFVRKKKMI